MLFVNTYKDWSKVFTVRMYIVGKSVKCLLSKEFI